MDLHIYRIFDALGDSIILSTYFKNYNVEKVYYNRGEFKTLYKILDVLNVPRPEFIKTTDRIKSNMVTVVKKLKSDSVLLIGPNINTKEKEYITYQLSSKNESAKDRNTTLKDAKNYYSFEENVVKEDVTKIKNIDDLVECLSKSKHHLSIDSGTAWLAVSMGIDTTVISKNSYYFSDAYHYMKYLEIHKNVEIYQKHGLGVKIPSELDYIITSQENNVAVGSYSNYIKEVKSL